MNLCGAGTTNLLGATVSVWVYIQTASTIAAGSDASIYLYTTASSFYPIPPGTISSLNANTWFQVSGTITNPAAVNSTRIELEFYNNSSAPFTGTVYFDDLTIGP